MSDTTYDKLHQLAKHGRFNRPVHMQVMVVMASGEVFSLEIPTDLHDDAEFTWTTGSDWSDPAVPGGRQEITRTVEFTAKAVYAGAADREGQMYRIGTFGGAEPGDVPGREVPEYAVSMLAQLLGSWVPSGIAARRGSEEFNKAVRGQATMTGQWLWQQAYYAGMHHGASMAVNYQPRVIAVGDAKAQPMKMPLFTADGGYTWKPPYCTYDKQTGESSPCGAMTPVDRIEAPLDGRTEAHGREVILHPCGHRVFLPDPVEVTFS